MAFARGEDNRLASSYDTCCLGLCISGSGGRVFPFGRGNLCRRAGAPACTALARGCTASCTGIRCAYASRAIPVHRAALEDPEGGVMTAKKITGPDPWLTPAQMIAELGISKRTWARMRAAGTAPKCVRLPGGLKCRRSWFEAWLAEREAEAA
jgi:hypothetical protein